MTWAFRELLNILIGVIFGFPAFSSIGLKRTRFSELDDWALPFDARNDVPIFCRPIGSLGENPALAMISGSVCCLGMMASPALDAADQCDFNWRRIRETGRLADLATHDAMVSCFYVHDVHLRRTMGALLLTQSCDDPRCVAFQTNRTLSRQKGSFDLSNLHPQLALTPLQTVSKLQDSCVMSGIRIDCEA